MGLHIDSILAEYSKEFSAAHYGAGDDGFVILQDVTLRSVSGESYKVPEITLFCSQIIGCFYGAPQP